MDNETLAKIERIAVALESIANGLTMLSRPAMVVTPAGQATEQTVDGPLGTAPAMVKVA